MTGNVKIEYIEPNTEYDFAAIRLETEDNKIDLPMQGYTEADLNMVNHVVAKLKYGLHVVQGGDES